jgi:hypothetical protein
LLGSVPGIWISSRFTLQVPQDALRLGLAGVLALSGIKLLNLPGSSYVIAGGAGWSRPPSPFGCSYKSRSREAETAPTILVLLLLAATATAFAVTQHLKLEPSPISQTHVDKVFSPSATARRALRHIDFLDQTHRSSAHLGAHALGPVGHRRPRFPKGMVHVRGTGTASPDGVYFAVVRLRDAQRTIDLPNPIRVDTVQADESPFSACRATAPRRSSVSHVGARARFAVRERRTPHPGLFDSHARQVRVRGAATPKTRLVLGRRDVAGNLSPAVKISSL